MASPTTLKVPDDLRSRLTAQAEAQGVSPHAYMLEALKEKADRNRRGSGIPGGGGKRAGRVRAHGHGLREGGRGALHPGNCAGKKPRRPKPHKGTRKKP